MSESIVFDCAADFYDETRGFPPGEDVKVGAFIGQVAGLTKNDRILEIGIGTGRIALPLLPHTGSYFGVDLSIPMMERLREKQQEGQNVRLIQGDVTRLPLPSDSFDAAMIVHVFHLVSDPDATAHELARVLRPGGKAIHCWNRYELAFQPLYKAWEEATRHQIFPVYERNKARQVLDDHNWSPVGEEHVYEYLSRRSPAQVADMYRRRVWSSLWNIPDDVWREGVKAVEQAMKENYPNPDVPINIPADFHVRVYTVP